MWTDPSAKSHLSPFQNKKTCLKIRPFLNAPITHTQEHHDRGEKQFSNITIMLIDDQKALLSISQVTKLDTPDIKKQMMKTLVNTHNKPCYIKKLKANINWIIPCEQMVKNHIKGNLQTLLISIQAVRKFLSFLRRNKEKN